MSFGDFVALAAQELDCIIPQVYFSFQSFTPESYRDLYNSRKAFDCEPAIESQLVEWIGGRFSVELPSRNPLSKHVENPVKCVIVQKQIIASQFIGPSADLFFIFCEDGTLQILGLRSTAAEMVMTVRTFARPFEVSDATFFCALKSCLLIVDVGKNTVYRVSGQGDSDRLCHSCPVTHIAAMGNTVVYVVDWHLIVSSPAHEFPFRRRTIAAEVERITQLQTIPAFSVIVYVTEGGRLVILSARKAKLLGTIQFRNEIVEKLLITESWGFIICKTNKNCYTYSLSGTLLSQVEFPNVILAWTCYTVSGCDIVVLIDVDFRIMRYEAFHAEQLEQIKIIKKAILTLKVNRQKDVLVLIASDGRAVFLPLPLIGLK
jgi:hypothetical protein